MLRGVALFSHSKRNLATGIPGVRHGDYVLQGHAYLFIHTAVSDEILEHITQLIQDGYLNNTAVASTMGRYHHRFFLLDPPCLAQRTSLTTSIQILSDKGGQSGYEQALRRQRGGVCANATRKAAVNNLPAGFKHIRGKDG